MTTLTKADLEKIIDEQTAELEALKAESAETATDDGAKDKEIAEAKGLAASLQEDNQKLRDELDKKQVRITELTEAGNDTHDDLGKERDRADKAEIALAEQNAELTKLRSENSKLREKVERLARAGSTLHGHIDDFKAPY